MTETKKKHKQKFGIEKNSDGTYTVVDLNNEVTSYSKTLSNKALKLIEETGVLPFGVKKEVYNYPVATFATLTEAQKFKETGSNPEPKQMGIFKSIAQYKKAKQLAKQLSN